MRVLIVDDEDFARQRVRRLLEAEGGVEVVGECAGGREAVGAIAEQRPDLVFLDVQMPRLDGFAVLRELQDLPEPADGTPPVAPLVIFVTAFDEHALRAFDVHALDYLLKPVDPDRFRVALARAREQHARSTAAERHARLLAVLGEAGMPSGGGAAGEGPPSPALAESIGGGSSPRAPLDRLLIKEEGRMYVVKTSEIDWVEAYGNYARLHVGPRAHLIRETMNNLERTLDPARFARIHRSTIVNLDRVKEMQPWFSGEYVVLLADGTKLKLSRWYRERLEQRLGR
ncbi:MAG TPA: LytTR family DNA-binding domain-containing protein [Gemmatimonadaceae bacterium]|nr:LytTR family DNA-binding domain-containing protein [Gemmatimonadaceae bacterium]